MWEMTKICGKWLNYLTNCLYMWKLTQRYWEMAKIFVKWLIYMGQNLSIYVRHKDVANDLNILNMASMCGKRLKYGFTMLEMT